MINKSEKTRLRELAGLIKEDIKLVSKNQNERGTLGFYIEQFLFYITSSLLNSLKSKYPIFYMNESDIKSSGNNLVVKFQINNVNFLLTSIVSYEQNSNTSISITSNGKTEKFNLNSNHDSGDVERFIQEIIEKI